MRTWIAARVSYANVAATLALLVALSGTAYAAGLGPNTVGSPQIKNNAVRSVDIKNNQVKGADVREGSLSRVPDAAKLGGIPAADYGRTRTVRGAFTGTLTLNVPGYGSWSLECRAGEEVGLAHQGGLGAGSQESMQVGVSSSPTATPVWTIYNMDQPGNSSTVAEGNLFRFESLEMNANASRAIQLTGGGWHDPSVVGCSGMISAIVLK